MKKFDLTTNQRTELLTEVNTVLASFYENTRELPVAAEWNVEEIKSYVRQFDLEKSDAPSAVISKAIAGLKKYAVHTPHQKYMGLFNPRTNFVSILADYISATLNPQLAGWGHAPFACEAERFVIQSFGEKIGYAADSIDGTFCSGGAESNLTAVIAALNFHYPNFRHHGVFGISKKPIIYCSAQSHHSIQKAASITGLGNQVVTQIPVLADLSINTDLLKKQIEKDLAAGHQPIMVVATAGTTGAGAIDDLEKIGNICEANKLWFHVDAAYGGGVLANENFKKWIAGIEKSDSVTIDLHKWYSVPMGTSLFVTSDKKILHQSFQVKTDYMPADGDQEETIDAYIHSVQWSRSFIGFKIFLPLAVFGWEGYSETIAHQVKMGNELRKLLKASGWEIRNNSHLPIVCFTHPDLEKNNQLVVDLDHEISTSGETWISVYPIHGENTLRACITNYATTVEDLKEFVALINRKREAIIRKNIL